jgi:hypothetical protein
VRAQLVRPVALTALTGFILLASSSAAFGATAGSLRGQSSPIVKGTCSSRPKAAILLDSALSPAGSPSSSGSASASPTAKPSSTKSTSPSATPSSTKSTSPTPKPTSTKKPKPTPKPTTTHSSSPTSKPSKTPTPTPTPTKTSPSPSPSPSKTPQLCVSVQSLTSSSQVRPGHDASYAIWVWSTNGTSESVSVAARISHARHVDTPHFTVCPSSGASVCKVGALPAGQADELQVAARVQSSAVNGEQVELTATVSGKNARSYDAAGSIVVKASKAPSTSSSPPPTPTTTVTLPPVSLPPASGTGISGTGISGTGVTPGDPAGLFPTVSPDPSPSPSGLGFPPAKKKQNPRAATAAAIVPLDPQLIGGQLAGLAVLAGAIAIAIARLSLRKPRSQDGPGNQKAGK